MTIALNHDKQCRFWCGDRYMHDSLNASLCVLIHTNTPSVLKIVFPAEHWHDNGDYIRASLRPGCFDLKFKHTHRIKGTLFVSLQTSMWLSTLIDTPWPLGKELLNLFFLSLGEKEFRFIERGLLKC